MTAVPSGAGLSNVQEWVTVAGVHVFSADLPAAEHDQVWRALRAEHPRSGLVPVLLNGPSRVAAWSEEWPPEAQGPAALAEVRQIDPVEHMAMLQRSVREWAAAESGGEPTDEYDPEVLAATLPAVAEAVPGRRAYTSTYPPDGVLLVPAEAAHDVPVLVPYLITPPNWFGAPWHPDLTWYDHYAVLRLWQERHGAELFYAGGSTIELAVSRPPTAALDVARCAIEQWVYCGDLSQKLGDVDVVARRQAPAVHWSFWWD